MDPAKALAGGMMMVMLLYLFIIVLGFAYFGLWVYSVYHCLTKGPEKDRVLWILVICMVPLFGVIFYHAVGRKTPRPNTPLPAPAGAGPPVLARVDDDTAAVLKAASLSDERERAAAVVRALSEQSARRRSQGQQ